MRRLLALLLVTSVGCTGTLRPPRPPGSAAATPTARCLELDDRRIVWGAIQDAALVMTGLGTGGAAVDLPKEARTSLALGSLGFLSLAAFARAMSEGATSAHQAECR